MHINANGSEVCSVKLWELGRLRCSFRCRSVWIRKPVVVRVVGLDTSRPMATNMWGVLVLRRGRKERPQGPPPHVACCTTTASSCTCRGWGFPRLDCLTAELSRLGTPCSGSGRFGERRSPSGVEGKFARPCLWFNVGLPASSRRVSLSWLSTITSASLSLSLSLSLSPSPSTSLPLSASLDIVMHTDNCGNLKPCWKTWCDHDRQLLFQDVVGVHVLVACSVADTHHLFTFRCFSVLS